MVVLHGQLGDYATESNERESLCDEKERDYGREEARREGEDPP